MAQENLGSYRENRVVKYVFHIANIRNTVKEKYKNKEKKGINIPHVSRNISCVPRVRHKTIINR